MISSKARIGFESPPNSPGAQQMLAMEAGGGSLVGAVLCASRRPGPQRGRTGARRGCRRQRKKTEWPGLGQHLYLLQGRRQIPDN